MRRKPSIGDRIFDTANTILLLMLIAVTAYPFIYIVALSFSSAGAVMANKVTIFPVNFNISAYKKVLDNSYFWISYKNTILYAVLGTLCQLTGTSLLAYPLSKSRLMWRKGFSYFVAFTMYFGGGMIPYYLLINTLHLRNSIWVMIIPGFVSVWNAIILRTYFQTSVPVELEESATIDGMGQLGILARIYIPLSKPIYSTLILFIVVDIWNNYFSAMIFLDNKKLYPLQVYLRNLFATGIAEGEGSIATGSGQAFVVAESLKSATIVVSILPILMIYPFIQRYFTKGVMIGSIKG